LRDHLLPLIHRSQNPEALRRELIHLPLILAFDKNRQALLSDEWIRKQIVDEAHNDRDAYAARNDPRKLQRALVKTSRASPSAGTTRSWKNGEPTRISSSRRYDEVMEEWRANKNLLIEEFMEKYEEEERTRSQYYASDKT